MSKDHDDRGEQDSMGEVPKSVSARRLAAGRCNAQLSAGPTAPPGNTWTPRDEPRGPIPAPRAEAMLLAVDELRTAEAGSRRWWRVSRTQPGLLTDDDWLDLAGIAAMTNPEIACAMAELGRTRSPRKASRLLRRIRSDVEDTLVATYGSVARAAEEVSWWYELVARQAAAALSAV